MRHSVLLALLLSVSSLFAGEQDRSNAVDQTNAELSRVRAEATLIREELAQARAEKEEAFSSIKAEEEILKKNKTIVEVKTDIH